MLVIELKATNLLNLLLTTLGYYISFIIDSKLYTLSEPIAFYVVLVELSNEFKTELKAAYSIDL